MDILTTTLLWLGLFAAIFLVALVALPVLVRIQVTTEPRISFRCDARALLGLAPPVTLVDGTKVQSTGSQTDRGRKSRARGIDKMRLFKAVRGLITDIFQHVHLQSLVIACEFGLDDPADTGELAGAVLPLVHATPITRIRKVDIALAPNFERPCFEGEVTATLRFTLAALFLPLARFVWRVMGPAR